MKLSLLLVCMGIAIMSSGQATLTVDKTHIRIGDQLHATIELISTMGGEWINREDPWPDSMGNIEIISGPDTVEGRDPEVEVVWTLTFFDSGYIRIPPVPVVISHHGRIDTFFTEALPITVVTVEPDSSGLIPIKDIYAQGFDIRYYYRYIPYIIAVLLLIGGLIYWLLRPKKPIIMAPLPPPPPLPHIWALQQLDQLYEKGLWQKGDVKEHYTQLTGILRGYLERRFNIHALEQTSPEIIDQLHSLGLSAGMQNDTSELLSLADLVKFAKAEPGTDIHTAAIEKVRSFVRATTPVSVDDESKAK